MHLTSTRTRSRSPSCPAELPRQQSCQPVSSLALTVVAIDLSYNSESPRTSAMKVYNSIPDNLLAWARQQPLFFVASAPLTGKHVNCSPKGLPGATFTVFDTNHCAYIDATGSGSETIAHCYENGRVTIMFCSFDTLPRIMRWFCKGTVIEKDDPRFEPTIERMGKKRDAGQRAVIMLEVWKVITSCGTGVPLVGRPQSLEEEMENDDGASDAKPIPSNALEVFKDRESMPNWCRVMEQKGRMDPWIRDYNAESLDGVPAMKWARKQQGQWLLLSDAKFAFSRGMEETSGLVIGLVVGVLMMLILRISEGHCSALKSGQLDLQVMKAAEAPIAHDEAAFEPPPCVKNRFFPAKWGGSHEQIARRKSESAPAIDSHAERGRCRDTGNLQGSSTWAGLERRELPSKTTYRNGTLDQQDLSDGQGDGKLFNQRSGNSNNKPLRSRPSVDLCTQDISVRDRESLASRQVDSSTFCMRCLVHSPWLEPDDACCCVLISHTAVRFLISRPCYRRPTPKPPRRSTWNISLTVLFGHWTPLQSVALIIPQHSKARLRNLAASGRGRQQDHAALYVTDEDIRVKFRKAPHLDRVNSKPVKTRPYLRPCCEAPIDVPPRTKRQIWGVRSIEWQKTRSVARVRAVTRALTAGARCLSCNKVVLQSFISALVPSSTQRPSQPQTQSHSRIRRTFATTPLRHSDQADPLNKEFPFGDAPGSLAEDHNASQTLPTPSGPPAPWYLQVPEQTDLQQAPENPFAERQRIPQLPKDPPPLLESLLNHISIDIGLDYLSIVDLRRMDPPPALGSNLLMIFGTARSERHLNVSADRLCRWLRTTYKLRPVADGLLGRNELKLKLRRKNRRSKMLGAAGAVDPGNYDDGIHTGWICVNVGAVDGPSAAKDPSSSGEGFIGFGEGDDRPRIVIQMMTEEKRVEIDLESLWQGAVDRAIRKETAQHEAPSKEARGTNAIADSSDVAPEQAGQVFTSAKGPSAIANRPYLPRPNTSRKQARQIHTSTRHSSLVHQSDENELEPHMMQQTPSLTSHGDNSGGFPLPTPAERDETLLHRLDINARALRTNLEYLYKLDNQAAVQELGSGQDDRSSTSFLRSFYSNLPVFLEAQHWRLLVKLHRHALEIGHRGYTKPGLLTLMRKMHASLTIIPQDTIMDILTAILHTQFIVYPRDGNAPNKPSTAEQALRQSLALSFEIVEKMDAYGYNVCSDEVFLALHRAISYPKFVSEEGLIASDRRPEVPALENPEPKGVPTSSIPIAEYLSFPHIAQDRYHYHLRQVMKLLNPGPLSNRVYNELLETYAAQRHWDSFWSIWRDIPRNLANHTPEMYVTLYRGVALAGSQFFAQKTLRETVPQMHQEEPPVDLKGEVAIAVGECLQVARFDQREPFYISLNKRLELALNDHLLEQWPKDSGQDIENEDGAYGADNEATNKPN
ncbi:hypothetical protein FH972_026059 [Carpinus fangiana]|uniref:ATPase synthesis protein 25, mitochondrial n=1 Tax=Carpinus fangiana TaxID=176857 RepID=A0A5N6L322_9ROSI|nr:hypothetical protein FH972_026059 [Carpinus fangiana]